ncbi:MAG: UbiA family prenyltransferase [Desulfomonilaceae bacterium]
MNHTNSRYAGMPGINAAINWKLFLGLSRTPHGILDMATSPMAALLWLGHFPPLLVVIVGLITAFAGYTAVYALNDLIDYRVDKERMSFRDRSTDMPTVDEIMVRHPVAQGMLSFESGFRWFAFWAIAAIAGAWWLNPFCAGLFAVSASLEGIYCKLLRITHLKIIPSALVKASGGLAGVYAVDPSPSLGFVAVLCLWLAAWEVGAQNIANDIVDMEDDTRVSARTTLTVKGMPESVFVMLAAISMAASAGIALYWMAGNGVGWLYPIGAALLAWKLLLEPARRVYYHPGPAAAASLFDKASYMPLGFLILVVISIYFRQ